VRQMVKFWTGGLWMGANFEIGFLAITLSILVGFYFSTAHVKALDDIFHLAPFLW